MSSVFSPCFVVQFFMSFQFCNHLDGEKRAGCLSLIVFLMFCDFKCSVALLHAIF